LSYLKKLPYKFKINKYFIFLFIICLVYGYLKEMSILFLFVLLHELCHAIAAWALGFKIESIELFPFGGVARIDNLDSSGTFKEIIISIAGPLLNITVALIILILDKVGIYVPCSSYISNVNITLGSFNLLPGLPLDGGRVLRAVLCYFVGFKKATKAAVISGKVISILMLIMGIILSVSGYTNLGLFVMPIFIFISSGKEEKTIIYTIMKNIISKDKQVSDEGIMEVVEICAYENVYVREVLKYFELNKYHIIIVINANMEIQALLTESQVFKSLSLYDSDITLGQLCKIYKNTPK